MGDGTQIIVYEGSPLERIAAAAVVLSGSMLPAIQQRLKRLYLASMVNM